MATGDFDTYYSDEPFSVMDKNQRTWLDPDLIDIWRQRSVFRPLITFRKNLGDIRATSMTMTQLLDPHPDTTALSARQIWMPSMHIDSRSVEVTFQHNGLKIAYHKYDDMITYWRKNQKAGLRAIARGALGQAEVDMNDLLARNALIQGAIDTGYASYAGNATSFNDLVTTDLYDPDFASDVWLGMIHRGLPGAMGPSGAEGSLVAYTSPGVVYDIQGNDDWQNTREYLQDRVLLNYEIGAHKNCRYVQTPKMVLWNCGPVIARANIIAAVHAGDGAPNPSTTKVDGTYRVGQTTGNIVNYIQCGAPTSGSVASFAVNDMVTFHLTTTSDYGVTDGVDFQEGTAQTRRIVGVNSTGGMRLLLDQPLLMDFDTDLGGGVYGYVTKASHVHATLFVGGPDALVSGVAQQPMFYEIDPIDDFKAIFRFSTDQYLGYAPYRPEVFEVHFSAGSVRVKGNRVVQ